MTTVLHTNAGDAAIARRGATAARADRPRERRSAGGGAPACTGTLSQVRLTPVAPAQQLRAAAADAPEQLRYEGHASVYERSYDMWDWYGPYTEVVSQGAGAATLSRSPDVVFLLNHRGMMLARTTSGTLQLAEDDTGLHTLADLDPVNSEVRNLESAMRRGDMTEMSFAFTITRGTWSPDYSEFRIDEYDINRGDVSAVNFGANPATTSQLRGHSVEDVAAALAAMGVDDVERAVLAAQQLRAAAPSTPAPVPAARSAMSSLELDAIRSLVRPAGAR